MIDIIGYIAATLLTVSAIPQLLKTLKTKDVTGLSFSMLITWTIGCFLMLVYVIGTTRNLPLITNYGLNTLISGIITYLYCKYRE